MVEFYLLTFPRFSLRKKEHTSYFGKNRTHDFRTTLAGVQVTYLLDHTGDEYGVDSTFWASPSQGGGNVKTFRWDHRSIVGSTYRPYSSSSSVVVVV